MVIRRSGVSPVLMKLWRVPALTNTRSFGSDVRFAASDPREVVFHAPQADAP